MDIGKIERVWDMEPAPAEEPVAVPAPVEPERVPAEPVSVRRRVPAGTGG